MRKRKIIIACLCIALMVVLFPLVLDWLVFGNTIPSNLTNAEWSGFLGGYVGAIVGAIVSLIGIVASIRFTKQQLALSQSQFAEQNRLNNKPMLDCCISNVCEEDNDDIITMRCEYTQYSKSDLPDVIILLELANIGLGAALNIRYGMMLDDVKQDGVFWMQHKSLLRSNVSMRQGLAFFMPENSVFNPTLLIYYDDVLGNHYVKKVKIVSTIADSKVWMFIILSQDQGTLCDDGEVYYVIGGN